VVTKHKNAKDLCMNIPTKVHVCKHALKFQLQKCFCITLLKTANVKI